MIERKSRPCKGSNSDTKGLGCGKPTKYRILGLGKSCGCYSDFLLNTEAGRLRVEKHTLKASKPRRELEKAQRTRSNQSEVKRLKGIAEKWVHKYVRERDKHLPCISSGEEWNDSFQAGHLYPKGKFEGLRYDLDNISGQSVGDNIFKEGNVEAYRLNLIQRIGKEKVDELDKKAAYWKANPKRWEVEELKLIIADAKMRYKELIG